jgi:hypothetical protein
MKHAVFIFVFLLLAFNLIAQEQDQLQADEAVITAPKNPSDQDSLDIKPQKKKSTGFFKLFTGKPGKAAFYSLVFPGAGQFYNKDYWKVPIVWGAEGFMVYNIFNNTKLYKEFRDAYVLMLSDEISEYRGLTMDSDVRLVRDSYRKDMELSWVVFSIFHLLNVFEAFIDRHLMNFDVNENLGYIPFEQELGFPNYSLGSIHINLNKPRKKLPRIIMP